MQIVMQNPQASGPLVLSVDLECNTPRKKVFANVLKNSRKHTNWVRQSEEHNQIAVLCGSGPSLKDDVDSVKGFCAAGGVLFALNGAASFLAEHCCVPDYQIIMDAQPRTKEVVGPANVHMFASQCDPSIFEGLRDVRLWHATYGDELPDEQEGFPKHDADYCVVGGFHSVGVTALILLYAMGYRTIHVFGMDSSGGHVAPQPINDDDIITSTEFAGETYFSSLTMKAQADAFMARARDLEAHGCSIIVHGYGLLPDMWNGRPKTEKELYERMWDDPAYRVNAPGEKAVETFLDLIGNERGLVIDFACGTGRAGIALKKAGFYVIGVDIAYNCRDAEAQDIEFLLHDLSDPIPLSASFGYCTDFLEHVPPEQLERVVKNITKAADTVFFQISTVPDAMGEKIGVVLHKSVHDFGWWEEFLLRHGRIEWKEEKQGTVLFLVSTTEQTQ